MPRETAKRIALWMVAAGVAVTVVILLVESALAPRLPASGPYLVARPNQVAPGGGLGRTVVAWSTGNGRGGRVYVLDRGKETLFAEGVTGEAMVAWIAPGPPTPVVEFRLYQPDRSGAVLAATTVSRGDDLLSLGRTAGAVSALLGALLLIVAWVDGPRIHGPLRTSTLIVAAACGCGVTCLVFYPGVMSPDSLDQYRQAVTGSISAESSPPIMSLVWHYTDRLIPGPFGLMLLHALVFWLGLALIAEACTHTAAGAAICILGIGLLPPIFALLGMLWKDIGFGVSLSLFVGLVLMALRRRSLFLLIVAIVPLLYAVCVRFNAAPAVMPLACWFWKSMTRLVKVPGRTSGAAVVAGVLVTTALVAVSVLANETLVTTRSGRPHAALQGSLLFDLAGMSVRTGELLLPDYLQRPEMSMDSIRQWYDPGVGDNGLVHRFDFILARGPEQYEEVKRAWWRAVAKHPVAYLRHRSDVLLTALQVRGIYDPFHRRIDPNDLGLSFPQRPVYEHVLRWLDYLTPLFLRGWSFLLIAFVVALFGLAQRRWAPLAVSSSAIFYALPYAVVSGGSDFRYVWWSVVAAVLGLVLLVLEVTPGSEVHLSHQSVKSPPENLA